MWTFFGSVSFTDKSCLSLWLVWIRRIKSTRLASLKAEVRTLNKPKSSEDKLVTPEFLTVDQGTRVTTKLCNPSDLPNSEMDKEQEHVGKVVVRVTPMVLLQGKIDYDLFILTSGAPQNPVSHANNIIFEEYENSCSNVVIISQLPYGRKSQGSKVDNTRKESTMGSPKGSNSYGDGGPILGSCF